MNNLKPGHFLPLIANAVTFVCSFSKGCMLYFCRLSNFNVPGSNLGLQSHED